MNAARRFVSSAPMHPRGQPPLLCAGLVGHLMLGAPQQLLGLLSGFDGHLLRLLLGEAPLPAFRLHRYPARHRQPAWRR